MKNPLKKVRILESRWPNFTIVREVLHNNQWSHNLIGLYCFWVIRNFIHQTLSCQEAHTEWARDQSIFTASLCLLPQAERLHLAPAWSLLLAKLSITWNVSVWKTNWTVSSQYIIRWHPHSKVYSGTPLLWTVRHHLGNKIIVLISEMPLFQMPLFQCPD